MTSPIDLLCRYPDWYPLILYLTTFGQVYVRVGTLVIEEIVGCTSNRFSHYYAHLASREKEEFLCIDLIVLEWMEYLVRESIVVACINGQ